MTSQHAWDAAGSERFAVRRWHVAVLALILAIAAILRAHRIDATSIWCDEFLSVHISDAHDFAVDRLPRDVLIRAVPDLMALKDAAPAWKVWFTLHDDVHPPLYYVTLRLWRDAFGDSPTGIRSLSAVLGTIAVGVIFCAGRELAGTAAGIWVAALNALASNHIYYGQEARMYTLVLLWISAVLTLVLRIGRLGFSPRRGAGLAVCSLGAMLTLYLSSTVLMAAAVYALIVLRGRSRVGVLLSFVVSAIGFAVLWGPFLLQQKFHGPKVDWQLTDPHGHLAVMADLVATLPIYQFGVPLMRDDRYAYTFAILYLLPLLFARRCPAILLPWLGGLFVVGVPAGIDLVRTTNTLMWQRYTILLIPTLSLSIVAIATQLPSRVRWALPGALALLCVTSLGATYDKERFDFRNNATFAEQTWLRDGGRLIFMSTWAGEFDSVLLLACQYYWATPPQGIVLVESAAALDRLPRSITGDRIVLVAGDHYADLSQIHEFVDDGASTSALGVGTVHTMRRRDARDARVAATSVSNVSDVSNVTGTP